MAKGSAEEVDKFMLRLPRGMREALRDLAKRECRTMNAQVVHMLSRELPVAEKR